MQKYIFESSIIARIQKVVVMVLQDLLYIVNLPIVFNYLVYSRQSCCCEQLLMLYISL